MQELISMAAQQLGLDEGQCQSAITTLLSQVKDLAPAEDSTALLSSLPGAEGLLASAGSDESGGGLLGAMAGGLGGALGGGGALGALTKLQETGLTTEQIGPLVTMFIDYAKEHAGEDLVGRILGAIPGLDSLAG